MSSKIEFTFGNFSFKGEGEEAWLTKEFDKVLNKYDSHIIQNQSNNVENSSSNLENNSTKALGAFLKEVNAETNQTRKFLATAIWLHLRGNNRVSTSDVTKALKDNNQKKLGNPSDCLGKNINKGYCEKDGNNLFVTDDGKKSLGII